jgi:hypothetical protein
MGADADSPGPALPAWALQPAIQPITQPITQPTTQPITACTAAGRAGAVSIRAQRGLRK